MTEEQVRQEAQNELNKLVREGRWNETKLYVKRLVQRGVLDERYAFYLQQFLDVLKSEAPQGAGDQTEGCMQGTIIGAQPVPKGWGVIDTSNEDS